VKRFTLFGGSAHSENEWCVIYEPAQEDGEMSNVDKQFREIQHTLARILTERNGPITITPPALDAKESFRTEWYKLSRAHELELNKATLSYEHERLKILAYLNGGAAGAYLTIVTAKDSVVATGYSLLALSAWITGLSITAIAWWQAYEGQRGYAQAYRSRRQIEETKQLGDGIDADYFGLPQRRVCDCIVLPQLKKMWFGLYKLQVAKPVAVPSHVDPTCKKCQGSGYARNLLSETDLAKEASNLGEQAAKHMRCAFWLGLLSVVAFVGGAGLAALAIPSHPGSAKPPIPSEVVLQVAADDGGKFEVRVPAKRIAAGQDDCVMQCGPQRVH
jgi:hypothetical protein